MLRVLICIIFITCMGCSLHQNEIAQRDEYLSRAKTYYLNRKYPHALTQLELALELDPECKQAMVSKGWTLYFLKRLEDSEAAFQQAKKMDDTDPWMHYGLGSIHYKKALDCSAQIADMVRKIDQTQGDAKAFDIRRQQIEYEQKNKIENIEKAIQHFEKSLAVAAENLDLYKMTAMAYAFRGIDSYSKAIPYMEKYCRLLEVEWQGYLDNQKKIDKERLLPDTKQSRKEELDDEFERLRIFMDDNRQNWQLGHTLLADWHYELAGQSAKYMEASKDEASTIKHHKDLKAYAEKATQILEKLLKDSPEMGVHYRNLAKIALLQGKYGHAVQYLQKFIDDYPLADPRSRVEARIEMDQIQTTMEKNK